MIDRTLHCAPTRGIHEFNNNEICQCGRMRDDGTEVQLPAPIEITRALEPALEILASAPSMSLQAATQCVQALIDRGQPVDPSELRGVAETMRKMCAAVGVDIGAHNVSTLTRSTR